MFPPALSGFLLHSPVLCIMANISSVLLISMKRRFNSHVRKTFLLQHRHTGEDPC